MIAGDLAPAFSNVYPEILDPWVSEQDFRYLIQYVNEGLLQAFNPLGWRACVDAVLGIATAWLWEDLGFTGAKSGVRGVEAFIERWNADKSGKDAESEVRVIPLRRTGYLNVSSLHTFCVFSFRGILRTVGLDYRGFLNPKAPSTVYGIRFVCISSVHNMCKI